MTTSICKNRTDRCTFSHNTDYQYFTKQNNPILCRKKVVTYISIAIQLIFHETPIFHFPTHFNAVVGGGSA